MTRVYAALVLFLLSCCSQNYLVTVNQQAIYDPAGIDSQNLVVDADLQGCINFALAQQQLDDPEKLTVLSCPNSAVETLLGIDRLPRLQYLDLSDNRINNLTPLENLPRLSALYVNDNLLTNISPLLFFEGLTLVSLRGNDQIPCDQLEKLEAKLGDNLTPPETCID